MSKLLKIQLTILLTITITAGLFPTPALAETDSDAYVRTANYFLMSGTTLENRNTIDTLAKFDLLVIPAEAQVFNVPFFTEIRKKNPDIVILAYVPTVSFNDAYWSDALHIKLKKGIEPSWWLKDAGGKQVSIWPNTSALNLNSGWSDYLANFVSANIMSTGLWDGVFYDEVGDSISWVGAIDTDMDGINDTSSAADRNWAGGYFNLFSKTRSKLGSKAIIITNGSSNSLFQPYVNGRMFESFPTPWEGDGTWKTNMNAYLSLENEVGYDSVFIINGNTDNTGNSVDYRAVRFGLTSTLMGSGYFAFDYGTESHAQLWTYDEYDVYLGEPKGEPENLLYPSGSDMNYSVWSRDFENGKAVLNSTNSTQTIELDGEYEKIHGQQDPHVNNGSFVNSITLSSNDGILLLRPIEEINNAAFMNGSFARIFDAGGNTERTGFFAYDGDYKGGQRIIHYDLDFDRKPETVVANDTKVEIYEDDGSLHASFYPYTENYNLGINLAIGDIENDGSIEIVTGTENGGGPQIRIFNKDGVLIHPGFFAYAENFRGGVDVAIGDLNGDNINEIIAGAGVGGGPHIRVFNKDGKVINPGFFAFDEYFRGGVNVASGDIDGDGVDDIVAGPGKGGGPHIRTFDRDGKMKTQFFAFDEDERDGVDVLATDIDGDGVAEIIGQSSGVFTFSMF